MDSEESKVFIAVDNIGGHVDSNITYSEIFPSTSYLNLPNYVRQPFGKSLWEAQFHGRTWLFFGKSWMNLLCLTAFLYLTSTFDPPPKERLDKYWLNSPKFRILTAFHNPGRRPAFKISCLTYNTRYYHRGIDHPFGINEWKDNLFKLREDYLISKIPGIQYPYVFRQFRKVETPEILQLTEKEHDNCFFLTACQKKSIIFHRVGSSQGVTSFESLHSIWNQELKIRPSRSRTARPIETRAGHTLPDTWNDFNSFNMFGDPFANSLINPLDMFPSHFNGPMLNSCLPMGLGSDLMSFTNTSMSGMGNGCQYSSVMVMNTTVGPDGKQHVEKYARSTASNGADQIHELKEAYSNSRSGIDKFACEKRLRDRGRRLVKKRNCNTDVIEVNDEFYGDERTEENVKQLEDEWAYRAQQSIGAGAVLPGVDVPAYLGDGRQAGYIQPRRVLPQ